MIETSIARTSSTEIKVQYSMTRRITVPKWTSGGRPRTKIGQRREIKCSSWGKNEKVWSKTAQVHRKHKSQRRRKIKKSIKEESGSSRKKGEREL